MADREPRLTDALFEPVLGPERARRTLSARDIERAGGLPAEEIAQMVNGFGLSCENLDEPWFTEDEARVLTELAHLGALWPRETYLQISRVYGQALATIARAEVQSFLRRAADQLQDGSGPGALAAVRDGLEQLMPLADPILTGVHQRWIEHELAQASVYLAEEGEAGAAAPGSVLVALLFVDIKDFTAYVDTAGDSAGVQAIDEFDRVVVDERGEGQIVKALGDGFMLAYPSPVEAVAAGEAIIRRMPPQYGPSVHASVHYGPAVQSGGDYFGRTVNLAARLLGLAGTAELLATPTIVDATKERFRWQPRVTTRIRGFSDPIEIHRLVGPA